MREYHLSILGLDINASDEDIKSAYRDLSKKFHPDVNNAPDASEQFILIKKSYEYLMDTPEVVYQEIYYDDGLSEKERWRQEIREKARNREIENQRHQLELITKLTHYFRPFALGILLFNLLLAIDYYLPYRNHEQEILAIRSIYEATYSHSSTRSHMYDEIDFEEFSMRFERGEVALIDDYDRAVVAATMIFSKPMYAYITYKDKTERYKQVYNIYYIFGYIIPVMILLGFLFFYFQSPMYKLNVSVMQFCLLMVQLFIYFRQ